MTHEKQAYGGRNLRQHFINAVDVTTRCISMRSVQRVDQVAGNAMLRNAGRGSTRHALLSAFFLGKATAQSLRHLPRKPVEDAAGRCCFEESHWRSEDGEGHAFMKLTRSLQRGTLARRTDDAVHVPLDIPQLSKRSTISTSE